MTNELKSNLINRLLLLETQASSQCEEARNIRKMLEGVSTPSNARKGNDELAAGVVNKRRQKIIRKNLNI